MPACGVVLVNPGLPLATASVYGALNAAPLSARTSDAEPLPDFGGSFERLIDYASPRGNDLAAAALRLAPVIGEVLTALRRLARRPPRPARRQRPDLLRPVRHRG